MKSAHSNLLNSEVPNVTFKTRVRDESVGGDNPFKWQDLTTAEIFKGKNVVLFGLPGAFTPTCSSTHLPGYDNDYDKFKAAGVDEVYCLSVNDAFVMRQWGLKLEIKNVVLIPDGNADFTRAIGMLVKKEDLGFGERSWRYSMYVEDGIIKQLFVEPNFEDNHSEDPFTVSGSGTMLEFLEQNQSQ